MTRRNLRNIKRIFREKTGVTPAPGVPLRKALVLAAALIACLALVGFGYPLFSPLDQDALVLRGSYLGGGIVSVQVENGSHKDLHFQEQAKLYSWLEGEVAASGEIRFSDTDFPAYSSGVMTLDLSQAYDIAALEQAPGSYYLLLTNHDFLFGHDWMCSFRFRPEESPETTAPADPAAREVEVEEGLEFYFSEEYDEILAWNEKNFQYLQQVDELLKRRGGYVPPVYPMIPVSGPAVFPEPQLGLRGEEICAEWHVADGYGRLVGARMEEKAWAISVPVPSDSGGEALIPVVYLMVYKAQPEQEGQTFVYGKLRTFEEMESSLVYLDQHYAIYNATPWICPDVEGYLAFVEATRPEIGWTEEKRQQIRSVYMQYQEPELLGECIEIG